MASNEHKHSEIEDYGDPGIFSADAPVPRWLKISYITLPIWGIITFFVFWNGSWGWLDRGYWGQLQRAANTAYPFNTTEIVEKEALRKSLQQEESR